MAFPRISNDPAVMGGKPCIRRLRITVGTVVGLLASGSSRERILQAYPQLEPADIDEALAYAAWRLAPGRTGRGTGPELMVRLLVDMAVSTQQPLDRMDAPVAGRRP
jgi:uncharacterized protein (DUF433 family)